MINDIANELHKVRRQIRQSLIFSGSGNQVSSMPIPEWLIDQAVRVEVNEYDYIDAWYNDRLNHGGEPPLTIMGIRVYPIPPRFDQLPSPGWRIVDPFRKPKP